MCDVCSFAPGGFYYGTRGDRLIEENRGNAKKKKGSITPVRYDFPRDWRGSGIMIILRSKW